MYVTAHRVQTPDQQQEAIHSFLHLHADVKEWPEDVRAWPDENPGTLHSKSTALPVGGNSVRSYLDVLAPDGTATARIDVVLGELKADLQERTNPTVFQRGEVTVRFGVEFSLEPEAERLAALDELTAAVKVLLDER